MAQAEDWESSEEEKPLIEETMLVNREVDFVPNGLRMNASSTKGGQVQEEWFIVQENVPGSSVGVGRHGRYIGKGEVLKDI